MWREGANCQVRDVIWSRDSITSVCSEDPLLFQSAIACRTTDRWSCVDLYQKQRVLKGCDKEIPMILFVMRNVCLGAAL